MPVECLGMIGVNPSEASAASQTFGGGIDQVTTVSVETMKIVDNLPPLREAG